MDIPKQLEDKLQEIAGAFRGSPATKYTVDMIECALQSKLDQWCHQERVLKDRRLQKRIIAHAKLHFDTFLYRCRREGYLYNTLQIGEEFRGVKIWFSEEK